MKKTSSLIALLIFFIAPLSYHAQSDSILIKKIVVPVESFKIVKKNIDTINILKIRLEVMLNDQVLRGATINLYEHNELEDLRADTTRHTYEFILKRNSYYSIKISKPGLETRIVAIDTRVPKDFVYEHQFEHEIMISLFGELAQVEGLDTYYLDFPIGIIAYNDDEDEWTFRKKYTKHIKKEVNRAREYSEEKGGGKKQ